MEKPKHNMHDTLYDPNKGFTPIITTFCMFFGGIMISASQFEQYLWFQNLSTTFVVRMLYLGCAVASISLLADIFYFLRMPYISNIFIIILSLYVWTTIIGLFARLIFVAPSWEIFSSLFHNEFIASADSNQVIGMHVAEIIGLITGILFIISVRR